MPTAALLPTAALVTVLAMAQAPGDPHTIAQTEPLAVRALAALLKVDPAELAGALGVTSVTIDPYPRSLVLADTSLADAT